MGHKLIFSRTGQDKNPDTGLEEWRAYFANNESLARAFGQAAGKDGLATRGGVVSYNLDQLTKRIEQLSGKPELADTLEQLSRGRTALEAKLAPVAAEHAKPAAKAAQKALSA